MSFSAAGSRPKGARTHPGLPDKRAAVRLRILRGQFGSQKSFQAYLKKEFGYTISRQLLSKFELGEVRMTVGHIDVLGRALVGDETALVSDRFSISQLLEEGRQK